MSTSREKETDKIKKLTKEGLIAHKPDVFQSFGKLYSSEPIKDDALLETMELIEFDQIRYRIKEMTKAKPNLWKICFID